MAAVSEGGGTAEGELSIATVFRRNAECQGAASVYLRSECTVSLMMQNTRTNGSGHHMTWTLENGIIIIHFRASIMDTRKKNMI